MTAHTVIIVEGTQANGCSGVLEAHVVNHMAFLAHQHKNGVVWRAVRPGAVEELPSYQLGGQAF